MFIDFLFALRAHGVPVSTHEWMTLMEALAKGLHDSSLDGFYRLCRALCVKDVARYDAYDQAFAAHFRGISQQAIDVTNELAQWLANPIAQRQLTPEQLAALQTLDLDTLRKMFEERLREQKERHDGGNRWIGTGGTSPFGSGGTHPSGIRVGAGGGRSAVAVAGERRYREYRKDIVLDVRQIDLALRGLRNLGRDGAAEELDLDETIAQTGRNAGDIELVWTAPRRNRVKVILLMDVGGSMDPYAELMGRLFTAASRNGRFAGFRSYYFHNCVYQAVYEDALFRKPVAIADLLSHSDRDEKLVVVGDALMHPAELLDAGGSIYHYIQTRQSGLAWLRQLAAHFRSTAWLNPEAPRYWANTTIEPIASVFPMWPLTIDGLTAAVRYLVRGGERPVVGTPARWAGYGQPERNT